MDNYVKVESKVIRTINRETRILFNRVIMWMSGNF